MANLGAIESDFRLQIRTQKSLLDLENRCIARKLWRPVHSLKMVFSHFFKIKIYFHKKFQVFFIRN